MSKFALRRKLWRDLTPLQPIDATLIRLAVMLYLSVFGIGLLVGIAVLELLS